MVFPHYPYLPAELKMMIVDEMGPKERCLFGRCSRLSYREAKLSKNAIYGLTFANGYLGEVYICVSFCEKNEDVGFRLSFDVENGKHMKYQILNERECKYDELWRTELYNAENVIESAITFFKHLLKMFQKTIKMLTIVPNNENMMGVDFEIDSLKNLEKLNIGPTVDIRQFLPKIQRQLKNLKVQGIENCRIIEEWAPTYQVRDNLLLYDSNLNYSQFLRITAKYVTIPISQLTEQNIIHFIKSWHTRSYTGPIEQCSWILENTNFDVNSIFEIAQTFEGSTMQADGDIYIKQQDSEEVAVLRYAETVLIFTPLRYHRESLKRNFGDRETSSHEWLAYFNLLDFPH